MRQGVRGGVVTLRGLMRVQKPGGQVYWYLRRRGKPLVRLPDCPHDDPRFLAAYAAARADDPPRSAPGTVSGLIEVAQRSDRFKSRSAVYRATLRRHFEAIRTEVGSAPARGLRDRHVRKDVTACTNPADRMKAWRFLAAVGRDSGLLDLDPTLGVSATPRPKTLGHEPWTEADKDAFRARWPIGTVPRAAMELLNWTGFRIGDAVRIGPGHVDRTGVLVHAQSKVKEPAFVPWTAPLPSCAQHDAQERAWMHDAIAALGRRQMTFLATAGGRPRSEKGLGNMIREAAREAGVTKSAHGLRKTRGISLAEGGASAHQIMAWLGHQTLKEAEHYTRLASRRRAVFGTEREENVTNQPDRGANRRK